MPWGKFFWLRSALNQDLCLDITQGLVRPWTELITSPYDSSEHQLWTYDAAYNVIRSKADPTLVVEQRSDGVVMINTFQAKKSTQQWIVMEDRVVRMQDNTQALTVESDNDQPYSPVCVQPYDGMAEHQWYPVHLPATFFKIRAVMGGKLLTVKNGLAGAKVFLTYEPQNLNQQWYQDKDGVIRTVCSARTFGLAKDGKGLHLISATEGVHESKWIVGDDSIQDRHDYTQCLEIEKEGNGVDVVQGEYEETPYQTWIFESLA